MNSAFPNSGLKFLNHAINCLNRFGDVLSLHANPGETSTNTAPFVRFTVINSSGSALCQVFLEERFFGRFFIEPDEDAKAKVIDAQMAARTFQSCFRSKASSKQLIECELNIKEDDRENRIEISLNYDTNLNIRHSLTYEARRGLVPMGTVGPHLIRLSPQTSKAWLDQFLSASTSTRFGEVTLWCYDDVCLLKAKHEDLPTLKEECKRGIQTSLKVAIDDLDIFDVEREELLTFALKEFRAALALAETLSVPVDLRFSEGGEPLFVELRTSEGARVVTVLATSTNDVTESADQSTAQARAGEEVRQNPNTTRARAAAAPADNNAATNANCGDGQVLSRGRSQFTVPSRAATSQWMPANDNGAARAHASSVRGSKLDSGSLRTVLESQASQHLSLSSSRGVGNIQQGTPMESTQMQNDNARRMSEEHDAPPLFRGGSQATTAPMATEGIPFDDEADANDLEADKAGLDALEAYERATQTQQPQKEPGSQLLSQLYLHSVAGRKAVAGVAERAQREEGEEEGGEERRRRMEEEQRELAAIAQTLAEGSMAAAASASSLRLRPRPKATPAASSAHAGGNMSPSANAVVLHEQAGSPGKAPNAKDVTHADLDEFEPLPIDASNELLGVQLDMEGATPPRSSAAMMDQAIVTIGAPKSEASSHAEEAGGDESLGDEPLDETLPEDSARPTRSLPLLQGSTLLADSEMESDDEDEEDDEAMQATQIEKYEALF
ncbi:hypothetical protein K437DRAFT_129793 [Tilletiaria anomala UBC 951]|uniref:Rad9-domain-containing protein n=1 Tax=Tilletiaria anomala (strain ATCC 24038 / CBS 436.72 / UBC 951) TaxID=1037660 RepID=A0A066W101_TILAU|nr:uncharacterized protein K437DRAFT_129793 [Tilletiaria anomala UBC 951]KDN44744.1 hypothetical protein K437DRAFT_129793 [Tilletiaria anomala UBC 951]